MASNQALSPLKIGTFVDYKGERFRIVNFEKPCPNFAAHYIIQSVQNGNVLKAFKHELCQCDLVHLLDDFQNASQSDEELANLDVEDSINPPQKRFKSTPTECDLDKIAQARTERTTDKQTV